jgi:hypothetical protein
MQVTAGDLKKECGSFCTIKRKSLSLRRFFESSRVMGNKESCFILSNTNKD